MKNNEEKEIKESIELKQKAYKEVKKIYEYQYYVLKKIHSLLPCMVTEFEKNISAYIKRIEMIIEENDRFEYSVDILEDFSEVERNRKQIYDFRDIYYSILELNNIYSEELDKEELEEKLKEIYKTLLANS